MKKLMFVFMFSIVLISLASASVVSIATNFTEVSTTSSSYVTLKNFTNLDTIVYNITGLVMATQGDSFINVTFNYEDGSSYSSETTSSANGSWRIYSRTNINQSKIVSNITTTFKHTGLGTTTSETNTTVTGDSGFKVITLNSPANNTNHKTNTDIVFNQTTQIYGGNTLVNASLYLNDVLNETKSLSGTLDTETFTKSFSTPENITWYIRVCDNASTCENSENRTITLQDFLVNSIVFNSTTYETAYETYSINITANASLTSVVLDYNGTEYATTQSGDVYTTAFDIPSSSLGNNSVRWKLTYAGDTFYSDTSYQNVSEAVWTLCNATYTDNFLNVSFKDEQSLSFINASIPLATFEYYLGSGTETKTYVFVNTSNNYNYEFCATPDLTFNVDPYFQYKQGLDYPQRIVNPTTVQYTSTITNTVLYLLNSIDGIFVTFQLINSAEQGISGVNVVGNRTIDSQVVTVANGLTDAAGAVTFWLNPDFVHDFLFSKTGYDTFLFTTAPTQSAYTITLGGEAPAEEDCTRGISYSISPSQDYLDENTLYNFSFTISSSYWALDSFAAIIYYGNDTLIDFEVNTTQEGGTVNFLNINTTNQSTIYLKYYYRVNGSSCLFTNRDWNIQSIEGRAFSIYRLLTDVSLYMGANMFGVKGDSGTDSFSQALIAFFVLMVVAGTTVTRYGIQSETAIMGIIFGFVLLFDVGFGLIPTLQVGSLVAVDYFLSVITFLIFIVFMIKEENI